MLRRPPLSHQKSDRPPAPLFGGVEVGIGGGDIFVPHEGFDGVGIDPGLLELGAEVVAKTVRSDFGAETGFFP